ncbi:retrovirus-related Pol polyprotein from transposon 412 [Trichonephila clavipes]|nr:retrovirus-related Pol polyprotein from transposon 412 [Trichonephila clavipes]
MASDDQVILALGFAAICDIEMSKAKKKNMAEKVAATENTIRMLREFNEGISSRKFMESSSNKPSWQTSRLIVLQLKLVLGPLNSHISEWCSIPKIQSEDGRHSVRADVEQWCKSCDACSARKGPKIRSRGKLHRYNVGAPFERIAFDILGPSAKDCVW